MPEKTFRLYPYRWVVLAVFMFINLTIQMLWITYSPITGEAAAFYGVNDKMIGLLAMTFMIAFIPLSIPVSWAIDTYGFRLTVSIGAVLMGVFGIVRGLTGANYTGVDKLNAQVEFEENEQGMVSRIHWTFSNDMTQTYWFEYQPAHR